MCQGFSRYLIRLKSPASPRSCNPAEINDNSKWDITLEWQMDHSSAVGMLDVIIHLHLK